MTSAMARRACGRVHFRLRTLFVQSKSAPRTGMTAPVIASRYSQYRDDRPMRDTEVSPERLRQAIGSAEGAASKRRTIGNMREPDADGLPAWVFSTKGRHNGRDITNDHET